jgi:uncharacterized protein YqjF (DUF2071 family)
MVTSVVTAAAGLAERAIALVEPADGDSARQRATLGEFEHRPWPLPERPWVMAQTWHSLLFAHWALAPARVERLIPRPLRLDLHAGMAWIGITPFVVSGLRFRGTPPPPHLSGFPELNVRTYVEYGGKPGIWFFSLDTSRRAAVAAARRSYRLPYFWAEMSVTESGGVVSYASRRVDSSGPPARFRGDYRAAGPRIDEPLARWLAERYCLYVVDERGRVLRGQIHHPPWPLQPACGELDAQGMADELGVSLEGEALLHYARRQDTLIWALEPAGPEGHTRTSSGVGVQ